MSRKTWSYECEDEVEARGVSLLLERGGLACQKTQHSDGSVTFTCVGEAAGHAASLEAEMLRHHAQQERAEGVQRWQNRDVTRDRRMWRISLCVLALVAGTTLLNC